MLPLRALPLVLLLVPALGASAPAPEAAAVPLRADAPAAYADEVHAKVLAAAARGLAYDAARDEEVALAPDLLFIRPGARMWSPSACTMGFVFGEPGTYRISTAGHCASVGQDVVLLAHPSVLVSIGKVAASHANGLGDDWALVDVRASLQARVDPDVACVGGPRGGAYAGDGSDVLFLKHVSGSPPCQPRVGRLAALSPSAFTCLCAVSPGDAGAPVLAVTRDNPVGYALGLLTHGIVGAPATGGGTRVAAIPATVRDGDLPPLPS